MLRMAAEAGTTDIVATPHADLEYTFQPDLIRSRVEELTILSGGAPRIHEGCDFHLTYDNIQDAIANPGKYTIGHKAYLLVEFSDMLIFQNMSEIFEHMRDAGIVPVITHPERNHLLQQRLAHLEGWVREGCLLQVTGGSLLGNFGKTAKHFSIELLKRDLVHFIASDAHDTKHRTPVLTGAHQWMCRHFGNPRAQRLFVDNPRAAIEGVPLPSHSAPENGARKWYQFWR